MPSTYSPLLRFEEIGPGEQSGLWGDTTNKNIGELIEQAIAGVTTVSLSGGAGDYTLSILNGALDESRGAVLKFIGSPSGPKNIIIPTSTKLYVVRNQCGQTITVKTAAQVGGVVILNGESTLVFCDGAIAQFGIETAAVGTLTVSGGGTGSTTFVGGFIKSPGGTGALTSSSFVNLASEVTGTLPVPNGGTGVSSLTAGRLLLGNGTAGIATLAGIANGQVPTWNSSTQAWESATPAAAVTSFSGGTTGLTPATVTTGAITLAGTLNVTNGGTGATTQSGARTNLGLGTVAVINTNGSTTQFLRGDGTFATPSTGVTSVSGTGSVNGITLTGTVTSTGSLTLGGSLTLTSGQVTSALGYTPGTGNVSTNTSNVFNTSGSINMNGTSIGDQRLQITGSGMNTGISPSGVQLGANNWGIIYGTFPDISIVTNGAFQTFFRQSGNFQSNNSPNWATVSDENIKTNLRPINNALGKLTSLNPCHFEYKDELGKTRSGFIAQEFVNVFPGHTTDINVPENYKPFVPEGVDKLKTLDLNLIPYMVKAIQELKAELDEAKTEIAALKAK